MNHITIHGSVVGEPELRVTNSGMNILSFSVMDKYGKDEKQKTTFHNCVVFGQLAENVASSIKARDSVLVSGRMETEEFTKKDGSTGKSTKIICDEVAFSMRWTPVVADQTDNVIASVKSKFPSANLLDEEAF
jgi:single-strand DNA-binding protein